MLRRLVSFIAGLFWLLWIATIALWARSRFRADWLVIPCGASGRLMVLESDPLGLRLITAGKWPRREHWAFWSSRIPPVPTVGNQMFVNIPPSWQPVSIPPIIQSPAWIEFDDSTAFARAYPAGVEVVRGPASTEMPDADNGPSAVSIEIGTALVVNVPQWLVVAVTSIIAIPLLIRHAGMLWVARKRRRHNLCARCGFDLRASPERCPECGTPVPQKTERAVGF